MSTRIYYIKNVVRANVRANLIHKCFISRDAFTLKRAFKVYIRPILEYASCTWSPHHILKIQQVFNTFSFVMHYYRFLD